MRMDYLELLVEVEKFLCRSVLVVLEQFKIQHLE